MSERSASDGQPPRVFVSYSDDSAAHAKRVLELAQWLRSHGVDAHIDQFEESPEEGWPRWVYAQIREAEFVLVIATPGYLQRCEGDVARASGADPSVKFESHLSLQELHEAGGRNLKFIPVLFDDDAIVESVPLPLRGATCYRLPAQQDDLYRRLTGQPKVRRAPLGMLKTFDDESLLESVEDHQPEKARGRASLDEQQAEDSLCAVIDAGLIDDPEDSQSGRPRWRRSWVRSNRPIVFSIATFGVVLLSFAVFLGQRAFMTKTDPICRVQLTDADGSIVEGIDRVDLELPSGHQIEVIVEQGNTLRFACPPTAVQVQAHLYLDESAGETVATNDGPGPETELAHSARRIDGRVALQASLQSGEKVQSARLVTVVRPKSFDSGLKPDKPDRSAPTVDSDAGPPAKRPPVKRPASKLTATSDNKALALELDAQKAELQRCYERGLASIPTLRGQIAGDVSLDAAGRITEFEIVRDELSSKTHDIAACLREELESWTVAKARTRGGTAARITLDFEPRW